MGECRAESEVSSCQRSWVDIVDETFPIDDIPHSSVHRLYPYAVPVVGLYQMLLVSILAQNHRSQPYAVRRHRVSRVSSEACRRVPVAAVSHIIQPEGIVVHEFPSASSTPLSHPEAVEVACPDVPLLVLESRVAYYSRLIFNYGVTLHEVIVPQCHTLCGYYVYRPIVYGECRRLVLGFHPPCFSGHADRHHAASHHRHGRHGQSPPDNVHIEKCHSIYIGLFLLSIRFLCPAKQAFSALVYL